MNNDHELRALAGEAGVQVHWHDAAGEHHEVGAEVLRHVLGALGLPADSAGDIQASRQALAAQAQACPAALTAEAGGEVRIPGRPYAGEPYRIEWDDETRDYGHTYEREGHVVMSAPQQPGYHRLMIGEHAITLAVAPARCTSVADLEGGTARAWGLTAQLYSLRRHLAAKGDIGGLGDFTALARLARQVASNGCDALAISPVHAMFAADPAKYSPYAPSSRLFLNAVYADPADVFAREAIDAVLQSLGTGTRLLELDSRELIDWPQAARLRLDVLRTLYAGFPGNVPAELLEAFEAFRRRGGQALELHARFEALHAHHVARGAHDWRRWDAPLRDPASAEVQAYAHAHADEVRFHAFLQWLARRGLARAHRAATDAGMRIGLMADLAVGTDPCGSHAWSRQEDVITGLSPGAPPDFYNPAGQAWGLTAFSPLALRRHGFAAYRELLRAALDCAGGLRIDHALGMQRMWLVPEGASPADGAYVDYPFDDLMRLTALESVAHHAIVMGENLGTVPYGFNERIAGRGMLGMSVLWFEREGAPPAAFTPPGGWSAHNIATTTTHDLPTIEGWWRARDIDWRGRLDLLGERSEADERAARDEDKAALWAVLRKPDEPANPPAEAPADAAVAHVARTPAPLVLLPLEDALGMTEQPNLPGTIDSHPNWRQRLPVTVETLTEHAGAAELLAILRAERPRNEAGSAAGPHP